jgi:hypothetical protein
MQVHTLQKTGPQGTSGATSATTAATMPAPAPNPSRDIILANINEKIDEYAKSFIERKRREE